MISCHTGFLLRRAVQFENYQQLTNSPNDYFLKSDLMNCCFFFVLREPISHTNFMHVLDIMFNTC